MNRERLEMIKSIHDNDEKVHEFDIDWLVEQVEKVERYEKALCALLNLACEATQDGMIDIITDTLQGFELMEQYEEDALEGTNVLAQFISE